MSRNPSVSLTSHHQNFIEEMVASGRYHGTSEVIRAGLRLLENEEERRRIALEELKTGITAGLDDIEHQRINDFDPEQIIAKAERRQLNR